MIGMAGIGCSGLVNRNQFISRIGVRGLAIQTFSYVLDKFSGSTFAISLRKLRSAYSGYCLQVQRTSDDATLDVGFVSGFLDVNAIKNFCGSSIGYVSIWYDQSGNGYNTTPVSTSAKPTIWDGNKITVDTSGTYAMSFIATPLTSSVFINPALGTSENTVIIVGTKNNNGTGTNMFGGFASTRRLFITSVSSNISGGFLSNNALTTSTLIAGNPKIIAMAGKRNDTAQVYVNGALAATGSIDNAADLPTTALFRVGGIVGSANPIAGHIREIISFNTKRADISDIMTAINSYQKCY